MELAVTERDHIRMKLEECHLDPDYWCDILKSSLGITSLQQVRHLGADDVDELSKKKRYNWEVKALEEFILSLQPVRNNFLEQQVKSIKQKHEQATILLEELKTINTAVVRSDTHIQSKGEELRLLLDIPPDKWMNDSDKVTVDTMTSSLSADLGKLNQLDTNNRQLETSDILNNASDGLALRGVLLTDDPNERIHRRSKLLSAPSNIRLKPPSMSQEIFDMEYTSEHKSEEFDKTLHTLGYNIAAKLKVSYSSVEAKANFETQHSEGGEKKREKFSRDKFYSRTMCTVVPTAAVDIEESRPLQLSWKARKELRTIDVLVSSGGGEHLVNSKCRDFLNKYGSHANVGSIHFGGIYKFDVAYSGSVSSIKESTVDIVRDVHNAALSASYSGMLSIEGSLNGERLKQLGLLSNSYSSSDLSKTSFHVTRIGGPVGIESLHLWKAGLVLGHDTWAVIDRGSLFPQQFQPVWDLLQLHVQDFDNADKLAHLLQQAWTHLGGSTASASTTLSQSDETYLSAFNDLNVVVGQIADWIVDPDIVQNIMKYLDTLQAAVHNTRNQIQWQNILKKNEIVPQFFKAVRQLEPKLSANIVAHVKHIIGDLAVDRAGDTDFNGKDDVRQWVQCLLKSDAQVDSLECINVINVECLLSVIQETLLPSFKSGSVSADKIAEDLAVVICKLRDHFENVNNFHQHSFLITLLHSLCYNGKLMKFTKPLTCQQLDDFTSETPKHLVDYTQHATAGKIQLEAYLAYMALETNTDDLSPIEIEDRLNQAMEYFQGHITAEVNEVMERYVHTKDWKQLGDVLVKLMKCEHEALEIKPVTFPNIENIQFSTVRESTPIQESNNVCEEVRIDHTHAKLLTQLGLLDFYPRKITLKHIITIKDGPEEKSEFDLVDIPWVILQRLLMIDYRGRNTAWETKISSASDTGDKAVHDDILDSVFADFDKGASSRNLPNPMDIFLATFSCCDLMLRQVVLEKMFMCHLSVPFVMPDLSEMQMTLCLWALRSIVVECRDRTRGLLESALVECPMKVISFVRIGNTSLSKSQLLNDVLNEQSHHTFFNRESCSLSTSEKSVSNGLIEAAWFLPSGNDDDIFADVTMFLNLRGDASHCPRQTRLIGSISSAVTVVIDINVIADPYTIETMKTFYQNQAKVVLVLTSTSVSPDMTNVRALVQSYIDAIGKEYYSATEIIISFKPGKHKTMIEIRHDLRQRLRRLLKEKLTTLQEISLLAAREEDIHIDEMEETCQQGKKLADKVISEMSDMSIIQVKEQHLPMQTDMWPQYSKLLKAQNRTIGKDGQTTSLQESDKLGQEMTRLRKKQLEKCKNLSPMMQTFISTLCTTIDQTNTIQFYLQWLKLYFDKRSREDLPGLRQTYNELWLEFNAAKGKTTGDESVLEELKKKVKYAEVQLAEASCGLEHLLREVGQLYEASKESNVVLSTNTQQAVDELPMVAAKLILLGHPIEFMDRDASNIPSTWVEAILTSLATITGEKRVFVLSVLGIQSSGKSTLMNTMFGLSFAVSAGRCTRGVYIQLVEVDKSRTGLPFDYILIVDTEGLRAPELSHDKHEHDNELATLVIGLGDVIIVNIKGENVAEMKDVLQIAVHAFLRMKAVNLQRTCAFVHQNVSAANAKEKMIHGRQNLQDNLDEMTMQAAEQEQFKDIKTFRQIIDLDEEKCVWYFSDLWRGDPPMAPANPGYSDSVRGVKTRLLYDITKNKHERHHTFFSVSHLKTRVKDLWNGILADDFVFSFRNSLAVKAYSGLEDMYHEVAWVIEQSIMKWSAETASIKLERCETENALDVTACNLLQELDGMVVELQEGQQKELEKYFEHNSLQEITIQWKAEKLQSLSSLATKLLTKTKNDILQKKEVLTFELKNTRKQEGLDRRIVTKASELTDEMQGRTLTHHELQSKFNEMWVRWVTELAPPKEGRGESVSTAVVRVLYDWMKKDRSEIKREIKQHPLDYPLDKTDLAGTFRIGENDLRPVRHLIKKVTETVKSLWGAGSGCEIYYRHALAITEMLFEQIEVCLKDLKSSSVRFDPFHAITVIKMVIEFVDKHNKENSNYYQFTFLPTYTVRLAVHVCRRAVQVFMKMTDAYNKKHSPAVKLENMKNAAFNLFQNKVRKCTNEIVAADLFCDRLEELIKKNVKENMPLKIFEEVYNNYSQKKYHLVIAILEDLANSGIFENWASFLKDSKTYAFKWITDSINKKYFGAGSREEPGGYLNMASSFVSIILSGIQKSVRKATEHVYGSSPQNPYSRETCINIWLKKFCDEVETHLAVREGQMESVTEQGVTDIENVEKRVMECLVQVKERILCSLQNETAPIVWEGTTPYQMVMDKLWGCGEECPFCHEPCQWDYDHCTGTEKVSHRCIQHRPEGLGGYKWLNGVDKGRLTIESCNYAVQAGWQFTCRHELDTCKGKDMHPYSEYKTYYPLWDIAPSGTMESSTFWKWVITTYRNQLKDMYGTDVPNIPASWFNITKEQAVISLKKPI